MLAKYYSAFSINKEIGHAKVDPIHINFVNEAPVRSMPYRVTAADSEIIKSLIDDMVSKGLGFPRGWSFLFSDLSRQTEGETLVSCGLPKR